KQPPGPPALGLDSRAACSFCPGIGGRHGRLAEGPPRRREPRDHGRHSARNGPAGGRGGAPTAGAGETYARIVRLVARAMNKSFREGKIQKVIRGRNVHTQEELAAALEEVGVQATQVTLSRDIHELGIVKTLEGYREVETLDEPPAGAVDAQRAASEFLRDIRVAQNLVVLKTDPGGASPLAEVLDHAPWPEVVGTIAGENTVLVIAPDHRSALRLQERLLAAREGEKRQGKRQKAKVKSQK